MATAGEPVNAIQKLKTARGIKDTFLNTFLTRILTARGGPQASRDDRVDAAIKATPDFRYNPVWRLTCMCAINSALLDLTCCRSQPAR